METWSDFSSAAPSLASAVRALLYQYGPSLAYLATIRDDGGPRIHPVSPVIEDGGLFCFLITSAKRRDLERDGRYALHSAPPEDSDDGALLTGVATAVADRTRTLRIAQAARATPDGDWRLFELSIETATVVRRPCTPSPGWTAAASRQVWHAPERPRATPQTLDDTPNSD